MAELVARGLSNPEISRFLRISLETTRSHVRSLLDTFDVSNRTEVATAFQAWLDRASTRAAGEARTRQTLARPALVVLPVGTLGEDPTQVLTAAGMTRDLESLLARMCWFPVVSCSALAPSWFGQRTMKEVGRDLEARFLVSSLLRTRGGEWRIDLQAIDALSGHTLWSDSIDFDRAHLAEAENHAATQVVARIYPKLISAVLTAPREAGPHAIAPWELAHRGFLLHQYFNGQWVADKNQYRGTTLGGAAGMAFNPVRNHNDVFTRDNNGTVHFYSVPSGSWTEILPVPAVRAAFGSPLVAFYAGTKTRPETEVVFKNENGYLTQFYKFSHLGWNAETQAFKQFAVGMTNAIGAGWDGDHVNIAFYGTDDLVHFYTDKGGAWSHQVPKLPIRTLPGARPDTRAATETSRRCRS